MLPDEVRTILFGLLRHTVQYPIHFNNKNALVMLRCWYRYITVVPPAFGPGSPARQGAGHE